MLKGRKGRREERERKGKRNGKGTNMRKNRVHGVLGRASSAGWLGEASLRGQDPEETSMEPCDTWRRVSRQKQQHVQRPWGVRNSEVCVAWPE